MATPQGFEVHVRNVVAKSTEPVLVNFFKPHFDQLSIINVNVSKPRDKPFATLTFLDTVDGEKFLTRHGQTKIPRNQRRGPRDFARVPLRFFNEPIYCEKSDKEPNPWLVRTLIKTQKDRQTKAATKAPVIPKVHKIFPLRFDCASVSCGIWTYVANNAVFEPQNTWELPGEVKFGERSMMLTLVSGIRLDFLYMSTLSITTDEGGNPSFIFTMLDPPRIFQKISDDPISELMAQLGLGARGMAQQTLPRKHGPQRYRLPCIDDEHKPTAGSCLVYRIALRQDVVIGRGGATHMGDRMQSLRKAPGIPSMLYRRTIVGVRKETWVMQYARLQRELSSLTSRLPFVVGFQIQKLAQDGYLPPDICIQLFPTIEGILERTDRKTCVAVIRKLFNRLPFAGPETEASEFELATLISILEDNEESCKLEASISSVEQSDNVANIHRVKVTPAGIRLSGPESESNNRVLRKYPEHHEYFLRVQFCDDDGQPIRFNPRVSNEEILHGRFKKVFAEGITIVGRVYGFLGFSHSSLRAQSCWFMAPFVYNESLIYDREVIQKLGDFSLIHSPAKCAARIGQVFSDTRTAITIDPSIVSLAEDVTVGDRVFSDGVGTMSRSVVDMVCEKLGRKASSQPTCFQIRFSGAKGMMSLDSRLTGDLLVLRPSMIKFEGRESADIEICEAAYRPLPMYLNRQFIKILEDMGVEDSFFLDLQDKEVQRLRSITENPINAALFLKRQSIGESIHLPGLIRSLADINLDFQQDGFLRDVLEMTVLVELRLLKHKTRIPVEKGWHLHGLMDETGFLEEGQIFCVIVENGQRKFITGKNLIISRAPALHPGDVQLAEGVIPPLGSPLLELTNCICFSQKGERDLPSQLSGGDLDGDRYYIMWDENARPTQYFGPADYPRQDPIDIGRTVNRQDMTDFFIQFMESDQLGRIAVLHRILADQRDLGTLDPDCITLAGMHSTAVDFSKTGIPVDMSLLPKYNPYRPDFEAPGPHVEVLKREGISFEAPADTDAMGGDEDDDFTKYKYYESDRVLGKLYRAIDERKIFEGIQRRAENPEVTRESTVIDAAWAYVQKQCSLIQWKHKLEWARTIRQMYEENLSNATIAYSEHPMRPLSELEVFIGNILGKTGAQSKSQRELSTTLKESVEEDFAFIVNCILKDGTEWSSEALERSMACLAASLEEASVFRRRVRVLSFKYVAAAVCLREVERMFGR